jgi:hypothetical protein
LCCWLKSVNSLTKNKNVVDGIGRALLSQVESEVSAEVGSTDEHRRALAEQDAEQEEFGQRKYLAELEAQRVNEEFANGIEMLKGSYDMVDTHLAKERVRIVGEARDLRENAVRATEIMLMNELKKSMK